MTSETPALPPGLLRQEAPGYRGIIASGVSQKRKASHTLVPSDPSQSKKYRGLYQTEPSSESTSDPTIEHECSSQDLSEQDTPKTPVRDAFPSAGPELETTPRANRTTATEDPVGSAPLTTPTQTTTPGPAALAASFDALSVTGGTHATPIRSSTATIDPRSGDPSDSKSRQTSGSNKRTKPRSSNTVNSNASNRHTKVNARTMDAVMKTELHGAVFLYRGFYDDFFGYGGTRPQVLEKVNSTSLEEVRKNIKSDSLKFEDPHWSFDIEPFNEGDESKVYKPLVDLFNVIGRAVYDVHFGDQSDRFRPRYRPFVDQHNTPSKGDYPSDAGTKPDLVKGERDDTGAVHWGDVELVVECKSRGQQGDQNEAYLQLARYARAIFSHQIYRLHVFGVAVCGPIVTFVRFDRSGLLHSPDIDISTSDGADLFVRNMISLLSLPAKEFGYDPRYTFQLNRNNRLDTHFALVEGQSSRVVSSLLCHRKCCRGRATIASCLAATGQAGTQAQSPTAESDWAQQFENREIVHKKIWRHDGRTGEGATLDLFEGVFGVCQMLAFRDEVYSTEVEYPDRLDHSPAASHFVPTKVPRINRGTGTSTHTTATTTTGSTLESTNEADESAESASQSTAAVSEIGTSQSEQPSSATSESGDVDAPKPFAKSLREIRFASDLLMPKGKPLFEAQSALHVTYAIHDALLGKLSSIMAFAEAGMLHCDISAFNILLVNPDVHYKDSRWNKPVKNSLGKLVWNSLSSQPLPESGLSAAETKNSDEAREELVDSLKRGPYAVLCDAEHAVNERRPLEKVHRDRTGTPAFISAQLLLDPPAGERPVRRSFIHDLESLMWVLIWVVAHEEPAKMSDEACNFIRNLSQYDLNALGNFKRSFIKNYEEAGKTISDFGNSWSIKLAPVIQDMAFFFDHFLYPTMPCIDRSGPQNSNSNRSVPRNPRLTVHKKTANQAAEYAQTRLKIQDQFMKYDRLTAFHHLLGVVTDAIENLSGTDEPVDLNKL